MADQSDRESLADDVEMENNEQQNGEDEGVENGDGLEELPDVTEPPQNTSFLDYIRSPVVTIVVGPESEAVFVHQSYLNKSPWFAAACAALDDTNRTIQLPDDDLDALGCVLEYLYTDEYFPRRIGNGSQLEPDPRYPSPDTSGAALLRHARVYTLADKFGLPALRSLAHAKIHRTTSTARGEIAYARYVYSSTAPDDATIRTPVAAFWATRSHVLRHEAEDEFRAMCMEFPQFGFDVLSRVLDQREKGSTPNVSIGTPGPGPGPGVGRGKKRPRVSTG